MSLKETFRELKDIVKELVPEDVDFQSSLLEQLNDKMDEVHECIDETCGDVEYWKERYNDLDDAWMQDDTDYNNTLEFASDKALLKEMKNRRLSEENVIFSTNLREEMEVEILQEMFNKYNLEQLQEINEGLNRKR